LAVYSRMTEFQTEGALTLKAWY